MSTTTAIPTPNVATVKPICIDVTHITRHTGIAGQYSISAQVRYPDEPAELVTFVGCSTGGPIVMITASGRQDFVSRSVCERIGSTLNAEWVMRFFG